MSNIAGPWGFRPVRRIDGTQPTYQLNPYQIAFNNGNKIARGDPVKLLASGFIDILAPGTTAIFGIFMGCEYVDPTLQRKTFQNMWNAVSGLNSATIVTAYVIEDPNVIFEVQAGNNAGTGFVQGNVGNNANFLNQGAPNAAGISVALLDQTTIATTNTLPFRVIGLSQKIGNDNTSAFNTVEVALNFSQLKNTTGV